MGEKPNQQETIKAVEKKAETEVKKLPVLKDFRAAVEQNSNNLKQVWSPDMPADTPDLEARQSALEAAIKDVVTTDQNIIAWNADSANKDNQITTETIYAWIFQPSIPADFPAEIKTDDSTQVTQLQTLLTSLGLLKKCTPGTYAPETEAAIKAFQEKHKLTVDSKPNKETIAKLKSIVTNANPPTDAPTERVPAERAPASGELNPLIEGLKDVPKRGLKGTPAESDENGPVHKLQSLLVQLSKTYKNPKFAPNFEKHTSGGIDGKYGNDTKAGVEALQKAIHQFLQTKKDDIIKATPNFFTETGLDKSETDFADGNFGPNTLKALKKYIELNPSSGSPAPAPPPGPEALRETARPVPTEAAVIRTDAAPDLPTKGIKANYLRLLANANKDPETNRPNTDLLEKQSFIYKDHPEILLWVAASQYGNDAQEVRAIDSFGSPRTIILKIKTSKETIYAPPSVGGNYLSIGESVEEQLATLKQMLLLGPSERGKADEIKKAREELNLVTFEEPIKTKYDRASKSSDFQGFNAIQIGENPDATSDIKKGIEDFAKKALGLKFTPELGTETDKVVKYLNMMATHTQALDKAIAAVESSGDEETQKAVMLPPGLPITTADKAIILQAFIKDNQPILDKIYNAQATLEAKLLKLSGNPAFPANTEIKYTSSNGGNPSQEKASGIPKILFAKSYKITETTTGKIEAKDNLDFSDCTNVVVTDLEVKKEGDKTIITTSEFATSDLQADRSPSTVHKIYVIEEGAQEAEESVLQKETPSDVQGMCEINVSDSSLKEGTRSARPFEEKYDEWDEQIRISLPGEKENYVTLDLDVKSSNEFEKGEWIESTVRALPINAKEKAIARIKAKLPKFNIDKPMQVMKYTEEDNADKVGYIIFDTDSKSIVTISSKGDVEAFAVAPKTGELAYGFDQTKVFLGEDPAELKALSDQLPKPLRKRLDDANTSAIEKIQIEGKTPDTLASDFAKLAQDALGIKIADRDYKGTPEPALVTFAKELLERSKDHKSILLSSSYKQILIASFMLDNKAALETVDKHQTKLREGLESLKKSNSEAKNLNVDVKGLKITIKDGWKINGTTDNTISLNDYSSTSPAELSYSYNQDGSILITVINADASSTTYTVEKAQADTVAVPKETLDSYDDTKAQEMITKFFEGKGIRATILEDKTETEAKLDNKFYKLNLLLNGVSTTLGLNIFKSAQGKTEISIYPMPKVKDVLPPTATLETQDSLIQFPIVRQILSKAAPTPEAAKEVNPDSLKLPPALEKKVKPILSNFKPETTFKEIAGSITSAKAAEILCKKTAEALILTNPEKYKTGPEFKVGPNLLKFVEDNVSNRPNEVTSITFTPKDCDTIVRAFLKDNGSQLLQIGQDTTVEDSQAVATETQRLAAERQRLAAEKQRLDIAEAQKPLHASLPKLQDQLTKTFPGATFTLNDKHEITVPQGFQLKDGSADFVDRQDPIGFNDRPDATTVTTDIKFEQTTDGQVKITTTEVKKDDLKTAAPPHTYFIRKKPEPAPVATDAPASPKP